MKKGKKIFFGLTILLPIVSILNVYCSIPSKIVVTQNSEYSLKMNGIFWVVSETVSTESDGLYMQKRDELCLNTKKCGEYTLPVKFFNIPIKTVSVSVAEPKYVVPSGDNIGVKLYTDGVLVVNISEFTTKDGRLVSPAKTGGLEVGDRIVAVNGNKVNTAEELVKYVSSENPTVELTAVRYSNVFKVSLTAETVENSDRPRMGMWVRDSAAGIGTLTYYDPSNSSFAALGHAICDSDTKDIMKLRKGNIMSCKILSVNKGEYGIPGELVGTFGENTVGVIKDNNELGIYGKIENYRDTEFSEAVEVAQRYLVKEGEAVILANIDGNGVREYSIEITKVSKSPKIDNKGLVIKITDDELIEKTGGIVQGMSGCPILQNGKLIGAITHVFVNDSARGYGIFIENMIAESEKIE